MGAIMVHWKGSLVIWHASDTECGKRAEPRRGRTRCLIQKRSHKQPTSPGFPHVISVPTYPVADDGCRLRIYRGCCLLSPRTSSGIGIGISVTTLHDLHPIHFPFCQSRRPSCLVAHQVCTQSIFIMHYVFPSPSLHVSATQAAP